MATASVQRHRATHLREDLRVAGVARRRTLAEALDLNESRSDTLYDSAIDIIQRARKVKDLKTELAAIDRAVKILEAAQNLAELRGRADGDLNGEGRGDLNIEQAVIVMPTAKDLERRMGRAAELQENSGKLLEIAPGE